MIKKEFFGKLQSGEDVNSFTLQSGNTEVIVLEYGCAIQSMIIKMSNGTRRDIVLGYDDILSYENGTTGQGALIGRHANRILGACFELNGQTYTVSKNDGENHLHGVYSKKLFTGNIVGESVVFTANSPDAEDGLPGNVSLSVSYTLSREGEFAMTYEAKTDADTIINLTNHSYFNLDGHNAGDVYKHTLWLSCKSFCEADAQTCPTGQILPVENTAMDFTSAKEIGRDINMAYEQLELAKGYDHNFVIDKLANELELCAMAKSSDNSLIMETYTTQPGVQLYTANHMNETGKGGAQYAPRDAFCLETQHFPCSTTYPHFPTVILKKDQVYKHTTIYKVYEL